MVNGVMSGKTGKEKQEGNGQMKGIYKLVDDFVFRCVHRYYVM